MKHDFVRGLCVFLAFFLCLSSLPLSAFAQEDVMETGSPEITEETSPSETTLPEIHEETTLPPTTEPAEEPPAAPPSEESTEAPLEEPTTEETMEPTEESTEPSTEPESLPTEPETVAPVLMDPIGGQLAEGAAVTLSCATEDATICYALSYDGVTYSEYYQYTQPLLPEAGFSVFCIKAYATKMGLPDGPETEALFTGTVQSRRSEGFTFYFGRLNQHSSITLPDYPSPADAFLLAAAENLDFLAIADHSNTFGGTPSADLTVPGTGESWSLGKFAAATATTDTFLGLYGYEMAWQDNLFLGHIATFATPGFASRSQAEFSDVTTALTNYYSALSACPGAIGQFCHPDLEYQFDRFSHRTAAADQAMNLIELPEDLDCEYYHKALLAGWHLAPTFGGRDLSHPGRTAVLAGDLTEASLYDALRSRRAYATTDSDLLVDFRLNEKTMGSILTSVPATADLTLTLSDPTDDPTATVEVITDTQIYTYTPDPATGSPLSFQLPAIHKFYYLRVTQADGDLAVTAPIWIAQPEDLGISGMTCDTPVPVQNREIRITLELYNNELTDFHAESIAFFIGDTQIHTMPAMTVASGRTESCTFSYTHDGLGVTPIRAEVTATVNGEQKTFSETLSLRYHLPRQITSVLADCAHSSFSAGNLHNLTALAAENQILVTCFPEEITANELKTGSLLLIPSPEKPFSDPFLENVLEFTRNGGNLILWGRSAALDSGFDSAAESNRLLSYLGCSMQLLPGTVTDKEHNGGKEDLLFPNHFNPDSTLCVGIQQSQFYCHRSGCAVEPGSGEWLIKGSATTFHGETAEPVLLARETLGESTVLLAGSSFLTDADMPLPQSKWEAPRINQSILMALLEIQHTQVELPLSDIRTVRNGTLGEVYRIRGSVTAGTAKPHNAFPGTIYLQDATGGIAVVDFSEPGIEVGTTMEIVGYLREIQGNLVLSLMDDKLLEKSGTRIDPKTVSNKTARDYDNHGGELLQVEGNVISITYTANKRGVTRFTLKDKKGDLATVLIESYIGAGSTGENTLAEKVQKGRTVRVRGLLHLDSSGAPVLRVRNCEEVVYLPPAVTPNTGDNIRTSIATLTGSALGLLLILLNRKFKHS